MRFLRHYADLFYVPSSETVSGWEKQVPKNIADFLTPRAFAYWYMDDGDQKWKGRSRGMRFSINSFPLEDCELLCDVLTQKYSLKTSLEKAEKSKKGTQHYRLYVSTKSYEILKDLIFLELHPSMVYKFPL